MRLFTSNLPNDADMIKALGSMALPLPIATGDCCFSGVSENDQPICICVERKKVGDLAACINDGRYLHQLQIAKENGADVFVLIAEVGEIRSCPDDGLLEVKVWGVNPKTHKHCEMWKPVQPTMMYSRFDQYLTELDYLARIIVKRSMNVQETAAIIKALWDNFQTPPDKHNSLKQIYTQPAPSIQFIKPSLVRRVAAELPDIGWERSKAVEERFPSVHAMCEAGVTDWSALPGIGKTIAQRVVQALNNGR